MFVFFLGFVILAIFCKFKQYGNKKIIVKSVERIVIPTEKPIPTASLTPVLAREYYEVSFYDQSYCDKYSPKCITASGEKFIDSDFTAACSSRHALGERHRLSYKGNSVVVRCNDRGGFESLGRDMDLSKASFEALAPLSKGILQVQIEEL